MIMSQADMQELSALMQIAMIVDSQEKAQCQGKFCFPSHNAAHATISDKLKNHVTAYRCRSCNQWHVGQTLKAKRRCGFLRMNRA